MVLLYLYITIRSKVPNFFAHLKYIQEFTSKYIWKIDLGFYMATYERALLTMTDKDEDWKTMLIDLKWGKHWSPSPSDAGGDWESASRLKNSLVSSLALHSVIRKTYDPFSTFVKNE